MGTTHRVDLVERTRLPSGIRVLSDWADFAEGVSLVACVDVGSREDPLGASGMAHVLEHMAFRQTSKWSSAEMMAMVEETGGELNAFTTAESTAFEVYVPHEFAGMAVEILAELVARPLLTDSDLGRERPVLIEEHLAADEDHAGVAVEMALGRVLGDHPLGLPVRGRLADIEAIDGDALREFHRRFYGPDRLVIAASGRLEHQQLTELVESHFGGFDNNVDVRRELPEVGVGGVQAEDRPIDQMHLLHMWPGLRMSDASQPALDAALFILGGGMSSRLIQDLREERGLVYGIGAWNTAWSDAGVVTISTSCSTKRSAEVIERLVSHEREIALTPPSESELRLAKGALIGQLRLEADSLEGRVSRLVADEAAFGHIVPIQESVADYARLSASDVHDCIGRLLSQDPHVVALGPHADTVTNNISVDCRS